MTRTPLLIPFSLALTLAAGPVCAQTARPATPEPAAAPAASTQKQTPAPQSSNEPAKKDSATGADANAKNRSASGGNSPFDYRASEEISEDLPVSFPADI